ncbi:potassium channel family protein [Acidipropionibacterium jensenii]|uniref:potassium channel family protein n=1 Tax=Acidipropionibacterium jensenii TaxID=1749 RepID=UPI002647BA87|nr:potassium channel family protein [Acidipropionibacterium jensenii]MDN5977904.1 potassium channel family protein [Acidipropionibacterium jensenii]MDN6427253.1 potassium channel family protein [Acidipropionibacterium jensenii]MDN6442376.1 potassium channel family protein [Acidipropionibacterium jensenii]MDN6479283.1 potassium channel family protein [Acidipropionibacterium jensenii]MDN6512848.1 potassium channel family protein [Acidipropionibacterium jensenii]
MRVETWERKSEVPLTLLALAFLVAYAWPILDPRMDADIRTSLNLATWTIWAAFAVDLAIRLWLADRTASYALHHWYDVALVVLPMLRPLRLLRLIALVRILDRSATTSLVGRTAVYLAAAASASVGLGSLAILDAERGAHGANITTFGDALWWACETVTTVGYGDRYPVTGQGRAVAVVLMLVGIGLIGSVTATVAATILARVQTESHRS